MKKGRIIKLIGGLYTVIDDEGQRFTLKPLGIFRHRNVQLKVGDVVDFNEDSITKLYERRNDLYRPFIANVDQVLLVNSVKEPDFSFLLLDKFITLIESNHIDTIIIMTKVDLLSDNELSDLKEKMAYYEKFYPVIYTSSKTQDNLHAIKEITKNKINVLAGQTGAGKSSILNAMNPKLDIRTNEISKALGRGKHTTRHVELIEFGEGYIADTPGFSNLEFQDLTLENIKYYFIDFFQLSHKCKFNECSHIHEPGCEIKKQVDKGTIIKERYEDYINIYEEVKAIKPKYRRDK
ncbi:MAG: ribosome small subunit-dependent GTPase A [Candidatus Izemoplasmatales bacterium]|uniref:Small ribosomal subunit biogenesis GTPase RsgA n=1 Tax=Hujiaoplasma nucleasis TaxID=2725268 RepID=A0A7L6N2B1_9MOLU|nr:ribosome small subunit-dependent GTPase A [Hujiaoplasma nucleasis]QLY39368.1 ribosome small subunit-dependent GTPase A [Hujiaoplasma nucleasis]